MGAEIHWLIQETNVWWNPKFFRTFKRKLHSILSNVFAKLIFRHIHPLLALVFFVVYNSSWSKIPFSVIHRPSRKADWSVCLALILLNHVLVSPQFSYRTWHENRFGEIWLPLQELGKDLLLSIDSIPHHSRCTDEWNIFQIWIMRMINSIYNHSY